MDDLGVPLFLETSIRKGWKVEAPKPWKTIEVGNMSFVSCILLCCLFPSKKIRFSIINHPFWGTIIFGNTHILWLLGLLTLTSTLFWQSIGSTSVQSGRWLFLLASKNRSLVGPCPPSLSHVWNRCHPPSSPKMATCLLIGAVFWGEFGGKD